MNEIDEVMEQFIQFGIQEHNTMGGIGLWENEQRSLLWAATQCNECYDWVEVGSFCGGSAVLLCLMRQKLGLPPKVVSVDIKFNDWFDFNVYTRGKFHEEHMKIEIDSSRMGKSVLEPVNLAFIDGFHSFRQIITDFMQLSPILTDNALILFHDTSPHIFDPDYQKRQLGFAENHFDELMRNRDEDFFVDEAIFYLCDQFDYTLIDIPVADHKECHSKETNLTSWVRGKTSPFNSIVAIQRKK